MKPQKSKLNHWKTLIDELEKNPNIVAVRNITIEPIYPPVVRGTKNFIHSAKVECDIGTPLVKDEPAINYGAIICLEHQDECTWAFVPCSKIKV